MASGGKPLSCGPDRIRGYAKDDEVVLEVRHLSKYFEMRDGFFRKKVFQAVRDVSFTLPRGKTLGIVGESGSGKTTLGLTLMRLHKATGGQVLFKGNEEPGHVGRAGSGHIGDAYRLCSRIPMHRSIHDRRVGQILMDDP